MLAGFIFYFAPTKWTNKFQLAFAYIFHQPLSIGRSFSLSVLAQQPVTAHASQNKYNKLQNHLANMIEWLNQERQKVEKLSGLRDRSVWEGVNFVLADVVTVSIDGSHSMLIINRGKNDGLAKGQFVLGDYSIIGTISGVDVRTAQVRLITDPASKIAVKIAERSPFMTYHRDPKREEKHLGIPGIEPQSDVEGTPMIMQGNPPRRAKVLLLPATHKVKIGDVVYAQKKPGFLGTPIIVGTVAQCKRDDENPLLWDVTVKPVCDIKKLSDVTVIVMNPQE